MPKIAYSASDFPQNMGPRLQGNHQIDVTWFDIIWAAVSVGKIDLNDMLGHSHFSIDEFRYRMFIVRANLWESGNYIYRSPAYDSLDPTEKGAISYFMGMTFGKLIGLFLFNVPWLVHLYKLTPSSIGTLPGRSRPDLVGRDRSGDWIVLEAKGRSGGFDNPALDHAKHQVSQIRTINSQSPHLRVASELYFYDSLNISIVDPEETIPESFDIEANQDLFETYYKPFLSLLHIPSRKLELNKLPYFFVDYPNLGISIGLWVDIPKISTIDSLGELETLGESRLILLDISEKEYGYAVYPDGIAIALDARWAKDVMEKTPTER